MKIENWIYSLFYLNYNFNLSKKLKLQFDTCYWSLRCSSTDAIDITACTNYSGYTDQNARNDFAARKRLNCLSIPGADINSFNIFN